ncbi:preprotein translocase subunit SecG [Sporomusa aerivorans]|uniref:preprotein translocase subunit SecG n=1 Tax=Sporomusa aerivorans TaxID=204936 RepID=UPI00352B173E
MITGLMILEAVLAIALIVSVVLQSGKSAGLSGSIAGGAESIFGGKRKGLDEILAKATIIIAALFGILTMALVKLMQ